MQDISDFTEEQIDALREVSNIGAGHAATALAQLTDQRIMISVPEIRVVRAGEAEAAVGGEGGEVAAVRMSMLGDLTGTTLLMFDKEVALVLCDRMLGREMGSSSELDDMAESVLKELGNTLAAAYMNALAKLMGMALMPTVPELLVDSSEAIIKAALPETDTVLIFETAFRSTDADFEFGGQFMLFPDPGSIRAILDSINVA
ncbi:MAG: chemotaxis protein CheC [Gemmatimonadetes bacterium]|nr:chemotaxis protein CheC [Gemmatimonadota bacterium]